MGLYFRQRILLEKKIKNYEGMDGNEFEKDFLKNVSNCESQKERSRLNGNSKGKIVALDKEY